MIYWKEECRVLATERAEIVVVDKLRRAWSTRVCRPSSDEGGRYP